MFDLLIVFIILSIIIGLIIYSRTPVKPQTPTQQEPNQEEKIKKSPFQNEEYTVEELLNKYRDLSSKTNTSTSKYTSEKTIRKTEVFTPDTLEEKGIIPKILRESFAVLRKYFVIHTEPNERVITKEFLDVVELIKSDKPFILVTGGAGTGKTTLIEYLRELELVNVVLAFTGAAALNCNGKTIHSFFRLPTKILFESEPLDPLSNDSVSIIESLKVLVIDEISMVRADLLDAVDRRLRAVKREDQPFGGVKLVMIGDLYQLPPVITSQEKEYFSPNRPQSTWRSGWFFDANSLKDIDITHYELTHIFRQAEDQKEYILHLNNLRKHQNVEDAINYFNKNILVNESDDKNIVTLTADNATATNKNERELAKLSGEVTELQATANGAFLFVIRDIVKNGNIQDNLNDMKKLPAPFNLKLKIGALVMILKNDGNKEYVNGSTGIVFSINEFSIGVQLSNGKKVLITKHAWLSYKIEWDSSTRCPVITEDGRYVQYPLCLAWAITTHKSQGRTLPKVLIDFGRGAFAAGQTYVALSRTRHIKDVLLSKPLIASDFPQDYRLSEWSQTNLHK